MKKFIVHILLFFVVVFVLDYSFGIICNYLNSHAIGGNTQSHYILAKKTTADIIILGSSRAIHHYDPAVMEDSLNMTVYNAGIEANGIILMYGRLLLITQRYTPKIIIYDAAEWYDIEKNDNLKYLDNLKPYYNEPGIPNLFVTISKNEKWKMYSNFYRYNSTFFQMLGDNVAPRQLLQKGGFKPVYGTMNYIPKEKEISNKTIHWDPIKKYYFEQLISICKRKNIQLILTVSPMFGNNSSQNLEELFKLCRKNNITILNYYNNPQFNYAKQLFKDPVHLNHEGAEIFTKEISHDLKRILHY